MADNWPTCGNQQVHKWQSRGKCMAFDRHRSGPCVAIVLAHNRPTCGNQQVQKWQSRGAHMAVNRHRSGPYVAVVQAYKRPRCGNQQAHTWQSTGTYMAIDRHVHMAVNMHIRSSQTHMAHMWQLFVHTKGKEVAIKRSINW